MDAALASRKSSKRGRKTTASKKKAAAASAPSTPAPPAPSLAVSATDTLSPAPPTLPTSASPGFEAAGSGQADADAPLLPSRKRSADPSALTTQLKRGRGVSAVDHAPPSSSSQGAIYRPEWELSVADSALDDPKAAMQFFCHALLPKDYATMDAAADEEIMGSIAQTMYKVCSGPGSVIGSEFLSSFVID
jgi:hypothetical protein